MAATSDNSTRGERLAAKLRENLRRRKVQGRRLSELSGDPPPKPGLSKPAGRG